MCAVVFCIGNRWCTSAQRRSMRTVGKQISKGSHQDRNTLPPDREVRTGTHSPQTGKSGQEHTPPPPQTGKSRQHTHLRQGSQDRNTLPPDREVMTGTHSPSPRQGSQDRNTLPLPQTGKSGHEHTPPDREVRTGTHSPRQGSHDRNTLPRQGSQDRNTLPQTGKSRQHTPHRQNHSPPVPVLCTEDSRSGQSRVHHNAPPAGRSAVRRSHSPCSLSTQRSATGHPCRLALADPIR